MVPYLVCLLVRGGRHGAFVVLACRDINMYLPFNREACSKDAIHA